MAWAKNGTPSTLTGAADVITISDLTAKKFNVFLGHIIGATGNLDVGIRLDNISTNTYAQRYSSNGAADGTTLNVNYIVPERPQTGTLDGFGIEYMINIATEEKLMLSFSVDQGAVGAGTSPSRMECVGKYAQTSTQITRIDKHQFGVGDFTTGSNISAIGTD